jgi:hypothetical protein|tara:strand:+ start:485 stop:592 length:108 start_codon:yes stop_codon:yes gene_type:complete
MNFIKRLMQIKEQQLQIEIDNNEVIMAILLELRKK